MFSSFSSLGVHLLISSGYKHAALLSVTLFGNWIDSTAVEMTSLPPHNPRINTESFVCTSNPWWERLYRLICATDRRALRCHCMVAANWNNGKFFFKILIRTRTKWVEYSLHHDLILLLGGEILFSKKCFWKTQRIFFPCVELVWY